MQRAATLPPLAAGALGSETLSRSASSSHIEPASSARVLSVAGGAARSMRPCPRLAAAPRGIIACARGEYAVVVRSSIQDAHDPDDVPRTDVTVLIRFAPFLKDIELRPPSTRSSQTSITAAARDEMPQIDTSCTMQFGYSDSVRGHVKNEMGAAD